MESGVQSNVERVAGLMVADIRRRGLSAGDRYLTAQEAGTFFAVSPQLASRAMRRLASRDILLRKAGSGTFVGSGAKVAPAEQLRCIHILASTERLRRGLPAGDLTQGLLDTMAGYDVQVNLLSQGQPVGHTRHLLTRLSSAGLVSGLVLVGCSREVQELVCELGIPAVVFGGVFPSTQALASVDADWRSVGRMLAGYVLDRGRRRIVFVTGDTWLPGDNQLLDGLSETLAERDVAHGALILRSLPTEDPLAGEEIRAVLAESDSRPTAVICRYYFGPTACRVIESLGLRVGHDVVLITDGQGIDQAAGRPWPSICAKLDYRAQAALVGRMLGQIVDGRPPQPRHVMIQPVACEPDS